MGDNARKLKARKVEIRRVDTATRALTNQPTSWDRGLNGLQGPVGLATDPTFLINCLSVRLAQHHWTLRFLVTGAHEYKWQCGFDEFLIGCS